MGRSLATFNDLAKPTDDLSLMSWLNITATTKYWVGLVQRWLVTTIQGGSVVDVQYTNWESGNPSQQPSDTDKRCVALKSHGSTWIDTESCTNQQRFICQAVITQLSSTTATTTASTTTTTRSTSTTRTALTKPPLSLTSSSANAVIGGPDGLSSTTILVANESTSAKQKSPTSADALGIGIGVGVGVPVIIVIIAVVVVLLIKCRQNKSKQHESKPPNTSNGRQQNEDARNKDGGGMEMMANVEALEGSLSTRHLIDVIYADIAPSNHAVYANSSPRNIDIKQQPLPDVVYAEFQSVANQNGQQTGGRGDVSATLSTTAA